MLVSALTGQGATNWSRQSRPGSRFGVVLDLVVDPADGAGMSWLHRHTEVMEKSLGENGKNGDDGAGRSGQDRDGEGQIPDALSLGGGGRKP